MLLFKLKLLKFCFVKKFIYCLLAFLLSGIMLYADILFSFPCEITMYQDEKHSSSLGIGVSIGNFPEGICASSESNTVVPLKSGKYDVSLKVGSIPFKKVRLNITKPQNILVSGELIGLRIHNKGLIVTNLAPLSCNGSQLSPAQNAGILPGDIIMDINGTIPKESEEVSSLLTENTSVTIKRNNTIKKVNITPLKDDNDGKLKIGAWVRDSSAGVGTMTYISPNTLSYGALGHGISDSDTSVLFDVASGTIEKSHVVCIEKGKRGNPGQISGSFSSGTGVLGTVEKNCEVGIFGSVFSHANISGKLYPVGVMNQVETGKATILSTVDDTIREYEICILRAMPFGSATKGMAIEITDPSLLKKSGGIVQGMSGSPIIQNGKIIGAVTHVLVNDPTRGYGIFIENMLKEAGD